MRKILPLIFVVITALLPLNFSFSGSIELPSTAYSGSRWDSNVIPVCWENPNSSNQFGRDITRQAVRDSWEGNSGIRFTGWGRCNTNSGGIRILIADDGPHVKQLGKFLDGFKNGMVLNFEFNRWPCSGRDRCIYNIAVHEFGHALGFTHEQNRSPNPICKAERQGTDGDLYLTEYDLYSVMNYCNPNWNGSGRLSSKDIQGLKRWYGNDNYKLQAKHSGMCIHVKGASKKNRAPMWTWECTNREHFRFITVPVEDGWFKIQDRNSGLCWHIKSASKEDRAPVWTWNCEWNNDDHFKFRKINQGNGFFMLQSKHSGKCLHVRSASKDRRAPLWTWTCPNKPTEHFMFRELR